MPGPDPRASSSPFNRSAQHDAKRQAILSEAARLFNSRGSRATTLKDIAEALGLTKTSLYYYVRTKEALIHQCYMAMLNQQHTGLDHIERQHTRPLDRLRAFVLLQFEQWLAAREGRGPHLAALLEIASLDAAHQREVESAYVDLFKRLRGYLREAITRGEARDCETTSATRALLGSLDWLFSWLHAHPRDQVMLLAEQAWDLLARGMHGGQDEYHPGPPPLAREEDFSSGFDRDEQNRRKQQAFCKVAIWYFNKQGFNGTSLDEIAEQLRVSKGAFYYHIRNKEDLLFQCYDYSLEVTEALHREVADFPGNGLQRVEQLCRRIFRVQNSEQGPLIRYTSITALPTSRRQAVLKRTDATNRQFGALVRAGVADASMRSISPAVAQELLAGAINAAMDIHRWRRIDDLDSAAIDYFDIFFNGLLPRRSPPGSHHDG